jgi:hypothetical protein
MADEDGGLRFEEASGQHRVPRVTSVRALADGGSLSSSLMVPGQAGALVEAPKPGDGREQHPRRESPAKAARAQAEAEQAQAELAEAKGKVAKEQDAAIARALQEDDEARRQADLKEVAEKEAEAVPDWPPDPPAGRGSG